MVVVLEFVSGVSRSFIAVLRAFSDICERFNPSCLALARALKLTNC
jgi:hypothetical protein